jgi:glutathione S-transferase
VTQGMVLWGRVNSVNVQKVLWTLEELGLPYERIDAGMEHGRVDDADYRTMNPNGRVPTLVHGPVVLWESNSILRYLAMIGGTRGLALYPADPAVRAGIDRWMDWQLSTLSPAERNLFWGMVRTPAEKRDMAAISRAVTEAGACWRILDQQLADGRAFLTGAELSLADIVLGAYARRWFGPEVAQPGMPELPRLRAWYGRLGQRPGFARFIAPTLR